MDDTQGQDEYQSTQSLLFPKKGDFRHTLDGYQFNIRSNHWEIPGEGRTYSFILDTISQVCEPSLGDSIREGLADLLMAAAPSTVRSSLHAMNRLLRYCNSDAQDRIPLKEIDGELLEAYFFSAGVAADRSLKPLFQTFINWNRDGLPASGWDAIKDRSFKADIAYIDVLTLDPENGPYVDSELAELENALQTAYET